MGSKVIIRSKSFRELMDRVRRVAQTNVAVLITGETGTGKELIARAIHQYSNRSRRPFVDLNCAAFPDHLVESELFGYDKGAFSGAESEKRGMFELAHMGTLFLDEIADLDPRMQAKLLRVLDGMPYYRLGSVRKSFVDVRIIAAANQDLGDAVAEGRFRADLFHRLHQVHLRVPPLRERPEDIVALAQHFLHSHDAALNFSDEALRLLCSYSWPGNVRELRNIAITAAILAGAMDIQPSDLPPELRNDNDACHAPIRLRLHDVEQEAIHRFLSETGPDVAL